MDTAEQNRPVDPDGTEDYTTGFENYWGVDETHKHMLPDGKQYFEIKVMNEGERVKYEREQQSDLVVNRAGDTKIKMDPGKIRHALIVSAVVGWHLVKEGKPERFSENNLESFLRHANPRLVDDLEAAIRKINPWLNSNLTVEEIDKQIAELKDLREEAEKREKGE